jgi:hypothetical protein
MWGLVQSPLSPHTVSFTYLYSMNQEERSIFLRVTVLAIVRTKVHMNMWLILNGCRNRAFWVSRSNSTRVLFVGLDDEKNLKKKLDIRDKLLARILDAAARIKEREDQLRRKPCDLCTRVAKFKHLLWIENIHFHIKIKIKLTSDFCFFITMHNDFVFVDSKNSITVNIQNYTHVLKDFIRHHGRHYNIRKKFPFPPESPCKLQELRNIVLSDSGVMTSPCFLVYHKKIHPDKECAYLHIWCTCGTPAWSSNLSLSKNKWLQASREVTCWAALADICRSQQLAIINTWTVLNHMHAFVRYKYCS